MALKVKVNTDGLDKIKRGIVSVDVDPHYIRDGVEYGVIQELGLGTRAQPFLVPSFERNTKQLGAAIGQAIERAINLNDVFMKVALDVQFDAQQMAPVDTGALRNSLHVEVE